MDLLAQAPKSREEVFAYGSKLLDGPTLEGLAVLALAEVLGKDSYDAMAAATEHPQLKASLLRSGREELAHAHRLAKVIALLSGEPFEVPNLADYPHLQATGHGPLTREGFARIAAGERAGGDFYAALAARYDDPRAVELLRQNGREESGHGDRIEAAMAWLAA